MWQSLVRIFAPLLLLVFPGAIVACPSPAATGPDTRTIQFASENLDNWHSRVFAGETRYQLETLDGDTVLSGSSEGTASALLREIKVDLRATPWINWCWRTDNTLGEDIDERSKNGDDYPARIYLLKKTGFLPWSVIAVNYVWSSNQPVGSHWQNAWSDKAQMLAVASGQQQTGSWQQQKRNVRDDFKKLFQEDIDSIDAVAIMVDTDNSQGSANSQFGDIYFTAE